MANGAGRGCPGGFGWRLSFLSAHDGIGIGIWRARAFPRPPKLLFVVSEDFVPAVC
jgi:hypothetical protein